jgi:hypothetical protein
MAEAIIPSTFENFQSRQLTLGIETKSETVYGDYKIVLRAYTGSGISYKIMKVLSTGKHLNLRQENWSFFDPHALLQRAKNYIDNHGDNLIKKLEKINKIEL